jgi:hypothetical protein
MSTPIVSVQTPNVTNQPQPAAIPPKAQSAPARAAAPQDKVTISESAKQALADNTKPAAGGDVDRDGDSH